MTNLIRAAKEVAPVVAVATFSVQYRRDQPPDHQARAASTSLYYMPYMTVTTLLDSFDAYNDVIRSLARSEEILLVDGENEIPGDSTYFNDSVHFTDAGSAAMADRVASVLLGSPAIQALTENE